MLNKEFIIRKIKLIQEDLGRLEPFASSTFDELALDAIKLGATERFLERIITRAIDVNRHCIAELATGNEVVKTYEDTFLRMVDLKIYAAEFGKIISRSAGFRNMLVHDYDHIDHSVVFTSIRQALDQYGRYCEAVLKFIEQ